SVRLTRLQLCALSAECIIQPRYGIRKVRVIENVVYLGAEFDIYLFRYIHLLVQRQIELREARPMERPTAEVPELARCRNHERRRIEEHALVIRVRQERTDPRHNAGPAVAAECASVRVVDDGCRQDAALGI